MIAKSCDFFLYIQVRLERRLSGFAVQVRLLYW